jgi:hypothetical protein
VAGDIARDLTAAGRVADVDRVLQIELLNQFRQVVGVGVHVVAGPWLAGPPMPAAIMGDRAVPAVCQEEHLVIPGVAAERPPVAEDDGLALGVAPVLEVDLCAVFGGDGVHGRSPL